MRAITDNTALIVREDAEEDELAAGGELLNKMSCGSASKKSWFSELKEEKFSFPAHSPAALSMYLAEEQL